MADDHLPPTRASIIQRLRDPQDQEAWQMLLDIYGPTIFQYCVSKGLQRADALDISQEVLSKLQKFQYDPQRGKFRAWLGTATRNEINLFWRKKKVREHDIAAIAESSIEPDLDWDRISNAHILNSALTRIRGDFSAQQWEAFEAVALTKKITGDTEEFVWQSHGTASEVAKQLSVAVEWVYKTKSEILKRLRHEVLFIAEELTLLD